MISVSSLVVVAAAADCSTRSARYSSSSISIAAHFPFSLCFLSSSFYDEHQIVICNENCLCISIYNVTPTTANAVAVSAAAAAAAIDWRPSSKATNDHLLNISSSVLYSILFYSAGSRLCHVRTAINCRIRTALRRGGYAVTKKEEGKFFLFYCTH